MAKKRSSTFRTAERWTPRIMEKGFTPVSDVFLRRYSALNITTPEAMLLIQIMSFKWDERMPYPSTARLAERMACSERNIRKLCASLESVGYLQRNHRIGTSNEFDLTGLFRKLEEILDAEDKHRLDGKVVAFPQSAMAAGGGQ